VVLKNRVMYDYHKHAAMQLQWPQVSILLCEVNFFTILIPLFVRKSSFSPRQCRRSGDAAPYPSKIFWAKLVRFGRICGFGRKWL